MSITRDTLSEAISEAERFIARAKVARRKIVEIGLAPNEPIHAYGSEPTYAAVRRASLELHYALVRLRSR